MNTLKESVILYAIVKRWCPSLQKWTCRWSVYDHYRPRECYNVLDFVFHEKRLTIKQIVEDAVLLRYVI